MAGGRPSKYKPEYCDLIVEMLSEGASLTEFRAEIGGVSPQTVHNWKDRHPEFLDAFTRAETMGEAYWERKLRTELMLDSKANSALVKLYFANRFGWSDKQSNEITGKGGGPVEVKAIERKVIDPAN